MTEQEIKELARQEQNRYAREWRKKNPDKVAQAQKRWRQAHKDKVRDANARYWAKRALARLDAEGVAQ